MTATTYTIFANDEARATRSKKQVAIALATTIRADEKVSTRVETGSGVVVFDAKARKAQKRTKAYTRVVALPEGFEAPAGRRVAYTRTQVGVAILHDANEALYEVWAYANDEVLATFGTTRQCGRFVADELEAPVVVA